MLQVKQLSGIGLEETTFEVAPGECLALTGPSGAGKSLLLRAIADLDVNTGDVQAGDLLRSRTPAPLWRRTVIYVAAESAWWAETVRDHFNSAETALPVIESLLLPRACLEWPVGRLSTGEKQRLALARAVQLKPRVLLLDEPTAALDDRTTGAAEALIRRRMAAGTSIVFVTHDPNQAKRLASRTLWMDHGRITERPA